MHVGLRWNVVALLLAAWVGCAVAPALARKDATSRPADPRVLPDRQQALRDQVLRLESRMLQLADHLAETEPDKAERLREALALSGEKQVKRRVEQLIALLRAQRLSDADREQTVLLTDLEAILELLSASGNDADRRRAEREQFERIRRTIRALLDEQNELLQRAQQAAGTAEPGRDAGPAPAEERKPEPDAPPPEKADPAKAAELAERLRSVEQLQRRTQQKTSELGRQLQPKSGESREAPGRREVGDAAEQMQKAADKFGEAAPQDGQKHQMEALQDLQDALNEVDDALRQVRREELEETLTALAARFRSMLTREEQVLETIVALHATGAVAWTRADHLRLAEATQTQQTLVDDSQVVLRLLTDEGTTVILPELIRQMAADMHAVLAPLGAADTSRETQRLLEDIVALLREIVDAIEAKRAEQQQAGPMGQGQGAPEQQPLLPGSAELKLLRSSQLRVNERTRALAEATGGDPAAEVRRFETLAARQRQLLELARQMHERKQP